MSKPHPFRSFLFALLVLPLSATVGVTFNRDSLVVPESAKVTVSTDNYPGITNPNPRGGWYYKCANIVLAADGSLVASWQLSDNHVSIMSHIMVARSTDGGKTWGEYQSIAEADVWTDHSVYVVPQMSVLRDGRIVIISDWGKRHPGQDFPMLAHWQKPDRGMANFIFWSEDNGKTWTKPEKIDDVGGEPGYILEMSDGTLAYTRTSSNTTNLLKNPPQPWGDIYYRNEIVFSDDEGSTWGRPAWVSDSPFYGDCEVGLVELSPDHLLGVTRIGLGNGQFGHPSRLIFSDDGGRSWPRAELAPFYGQRPHIRKLQSGRYLVTYRNRWGTPGTRALVFDPKEDAGFQPNSWILDEARCELTANLMTLRTEHGQRGAVTFNLYPAQDDVARVEINATLRVDSTAPNGVAISAGCWVQFAADRVYLGDRPEAGFALDTQQWHDYRIVREKGTIRIEVDGKERLREDVADIWVRPVRFGNRPVSGPVAANQDLVEPFSQNRSVSHWRNVSVQVDNLTDYDIDWSWNPAKGYPDQFRRDRTVVLDYSYPGDCGYSSSTQLPDGRIIIVDYTTGGDLDSYSWGAEGRGTAPFVRAYHVTESDLVRN